MTLPLTPADANQAGAAAWQNKRLAVLEFPHHDGPASALLVQTLEADEGMSRDFEFIAGLLSDDARAGRRIIPARLSRGSFDFKNPKPANASMPTVVEQGQALAVEDYEYLGAYGFRDRDHGDALVRRGMEVIEAGAKDYLVQGNNRFAMPGRWFRLIDHFDALPAVRRTTATRCAASAARFRGGRRAYLDQDIDPRFKSDSDS